MLVTALLFASQVLLAPPRFTEGQAVEKVFALPEVKAFGDALRKASKGKVTVVIRVEGTCAATEADCRYELYVGENHEDHTVRWATFSVHAATGAVSVTDPVSGEVVPYDVWRRSQPSTDTGGREKDTFPDRVAGSGRFGYGAPDEVVTDTTRWKHPTRKVFESRGLVVERVELYRAATYPVFVVRETSRSRSLSALCSDVRAADAFLQAVLKANAGWAFEIAVSESNRFRYSAALAGKGCALFEGGSGERSRRGGM